MKIISFAKIFLLLVYVTSCVPHEKYNGFKIEAIEGEKKYIDYPTNPSEMRYFNSRLVWLDYTQNQMVFSIPVSINENEIQTHNIKKGFGPNEFGNIVSFKSTNEGIYFYDETKKTLFNFNLDIPIGEIQIKDFQHYIIEIHKIKTNRYLVSGMFSDQRFLLLDSLGVIKGSYNKFPGSIEKMNIPVPDKNMGCVNVISATENGFASIVYDSGIIEFFTLKEDSIIKVNEIIYSDIDFEPSTSNGITSILRSNKNTGFIDLVTHNEKILGLYSAIDWQTDPNQAAHAEYIFIYDVNGKPLNALKLQYPVQRFDVDPASDAIYGFGSDENGVYFVEFKSNLNL